MTAKVDRISNETVAFHAVGVTGEKKFDVLKAALVRFYKNYESNLFLQNDLRLECSNKTRLQVPSHMLASPMDGHRERRPLELECG